MAAPEQLLKIKLKLVSKQGRTSDFCETFHSIRSKSDKNVHEKNYKYIQLILVINKYFRLQLE